MDKTNFLKKEQGEREEILMAMANFEIEQEKEFFNLMKSQTIYGFTTVKEVMVDYRGYKVAAGGFSGCVDVA